jgi:hypothetical protein
LSGYFSVINESGKVTELQNHLGFFYKKVKQKLQLKIEKGSGEEKEGANDNILFARPSVTSTI